MNLKITLLQLFALLFSFFPFFCFISSCQSFSHSFLYSFLRSSYCLLNFSCCSSLCFSYSFDFSTRFFLFISSYLRSSDYDLTTHPFLLSQTLFFLTLLYVHVFCSVHLVFSISQFFRNSFCISLYNLSFFHALLSVLLKSN